MSAQKQPDVLHNLRFDLYDYLNKKGLPLVVAAPYYFEESDKLLRNNVNNYRTIVKAFFRVFVTEK
jgi:hypothetical protein